MNIFRLAAELFLIYILYKFIFEFIIPVYNSSQKIRKQFGEMQSKMEKDINDINTGNMKVHHEPRPAREGDYIEFEEIKQK